MRVLSGILQRLALLALSLAFVVVALEIGLRLFWDGFYLKPQDPYAELHGVRGWRNKPDVSVVFASPEFSTVVSHDAWGYRSAPAEMERTAGRARIVLLGDSFTYGHGVEDDETFAARLAELLPDVEVINTGVDGYGTAQQLLVLRDEALCFAPDVVVTAFFWSDVSDNRKEVGAALGQPPGRIAWFSLEDGELVYPPDVEVRVPASAPDDEEQRSWLRYSHAYRFLGDRTRMFRFWLDVQRGESVDEDTLLDDEEAWALELALLAEIDRLSREAGSRMLLLVIPDQVQVQPDRRVESVPEDAYAVQERLRVFAQERGIPLLDLLPPLAEAYREGGESLYYPSDRHLRAVGHELVARALAERLLALGWLDDRGAPPRTARSPTCAALARERSKRRSAPDR